jgi:hypothetical protein
MGVPKLVRLLLASALLLFLPATVFAQSSIVGVVRDSSGGVLPGVTVEATSPVLIEKVRSAVTDGEGLYRIVDLRPGPYTVTFTLPGFSTFRRDAFDLPAQFTATVNVELAVGSVEETLTVSGEAPIVDVRTSNAQTQLQRDTLESLPGTGRLALLSTVIPGASLTSSVERGTDRTQTRFVVHGTPQSQPSVDGFNSQLGVNIGVFVFSQLNIQEVTVHFGGDAEADYGGAQLKMVPREGGNVFSGLAMFTYSGSSMESSNVNDELLARHLNPTRIGSLKKYRETGFALGGPVMQSTLWFYAAAREGVSQQYVDGVQWNKRSQPASLLYEPDFSRRVNTDDYNRDFTARLTWQAAEKHKIMVSTSHQPNCNCVYNILTTGAQVTPEATGAHAYNPNYTATLTWTSPWTNQILLEAGEGTTVLTQNDTRYPGFDKTNYRITDQALNLSYGNVGTRTLPKLQHQERFAVSYLTGSHQLKVGANLRHTRFGDIKEFGHDGDMHGTAVNYRFNNGVPNQLTLLDAPWNYEQQTRDIALYVQDQWTLARLTLNTGLRFNDVNGSTPEQVLAAGRFVPERRFAPTNNVPHYRNLSPRVGAAYDLFGTGRTALKASLGHYPDLVREVTANPAVNLTRTTNRTWNDANRNFVPDCDLLNRAANGECGPWSDLSFGQPVGTRFADGLLEGFNRQYHNWQASVSLQHELLPGVGVNIGYYRTWYGGDGGGSNVPGAETNLFVTDNQRVTPADFNHYCITAPVDSRLPGGGGNQLCGLYDVRPALFGQVENVVRSASDFGGQLTRVYNGVDLTVNARFLQGGQVSGGMTIGRTVTNDCLVVDSPQAAREGFCEVAPPWSAATDYKFLVVYPLPWEIQTSAIYQNSPGAQIVANLVVPNAAIAPSLGRNLAACGTAAACNANNTIALIPPQQLFEPRLQQVDLRFSRSFQVAGRSRLRGNVDIFNVFNGSSVISMNPTYGPTWMDVTQIMAGRLVRVGAQFDF